MAERLQLAVRRVLELVLLVATAATAWAVIRGQLSGTTLSAIVPILVALSVTIAGVSYLITLVWLRWRS